MDTQSLVPVRALVPNKFQPRTYFDPAEMADLEASIRANGVLQPILVRQHENGQMEIIAGERRWRATKSVFGDDAEIPALIKTGYSDDDAAEAAAIENIQRADMAPTEEAESLARLLPRYGSDRDELSRRVGLSRSTIDKRLALMNCSPNVRKALNERKISLGHAELFAAAPKEKQDVALDAFLKMSEMPTVDVMRDMIAKVSKALAGAIFDKTECASCAHNSGNQKALFGESIDTGFCTNGECYDKKVAVKLEEIKVRLADEFPRIEIVRPGDNYTAIPLIAEGPTGVGEEQAEACRGCANFGAAISALPGREGKIAKNQCFDTACNAIKVVAARKAEAPAPSQTAQNGQSLNPAVPGQSGQATQPDAKPDARAVAVAESQKVKEWRSKFWRGAISRHLQKVTEDDKQRMVVSMALSGMLRDIPTHELVTTFVEKLGVTDAKNADSDIHSAYKIAESIAPDKRLDYMFNILFKCADNVSEDRVKAMLRLLKVDLKVFFNSKMLVDFLGQLTKSEIDLVAAEIGVKKAKGGEYAKIPAMKKDEMIAAITSIEGFVYDGKLPKVLKFS